MTKTRQRKIPSTKTPPKLAIFDRSSDSHIDALQVALLRASRNTILPEVYEIFGKDTLLKFLDIFAGTTVEVPSKKVLEDAIRDTYVYLGMEKARRQKKGMSDIAKDLAERYDIETDKVYAIYKDMKKFF